MSNQQQVDLADLGTAIHRLKDGMAKVGAAAAVARVAVVDLETAIRRSRKRRAPGAGAEVVVLADLLETQVPDPLDRSLGGS